MYKILQQEKDFALMKEKFKQSKKASDHVNEL